MKKYELPMISIIIPLLNEEKHIKKLLKSIDDQTYPKEKIELILVDGNSSDNTVKIINTEKQKRKYDILLLNNPKKLTPISMNIGIKRAKGSYIVRLDAHATYNKEYIYEGIIEMINNDSLISVGGYWYTTPVFETKRSKVISKIFNSYLGSGFSKYRMNKLNKAKNKIVDTVPYGIFRKEQLIKVNGYNEKLIRGQDIDLFYRLKKIFNGKIKILKNMKIYYKLKSTNAIELYKRQFKQGIWLFNRKEGILFRHYFPLLAGIIGLILFFINLKIYIYVLLFYFFICSISYLIEIDNIIEIFLLPYALYSYFMNHLGFFLGVIKSFLKLLKK
ncbi:glycosyl transferase [Tepiditoga spiralis]|uniref:Glycosyl transferase n=1 Tax=Tepiditoga spiralis TaxID=2108365 RepID=A0A7G1G1T5_9BACT|nr:glycosyltransferase [Tepiditoga spiralis]BBE30210.1 glycosyl transferase [Tepiditoga spiralis]